jgi:DNA helicase-2/ATP-dependent DNA helicase PcrA
MFTRKDATILLGPPGTGKTTSLLNIMEHELQNGVKPHKIGFVSFTRKATFEAKERAAAKFGFNLDDLPYFRTIHSLAFTGMGLNRSQVMQRKDYLELGRVLNVEISGTNIIEDGIVVSGSPIGDRLLFCDNLARNRCVSVHEQWRRLADDEITWPMQDRFSRTLVEYKRSKGLIDYTDMLERFGEEGYVPLLDVLIVDEAQDLSKLQWRNVDAIARLAKRVYIAGDDDQAIYRWAGADVEQFIALQGVKKVLNHSYRLPRAVHSEALKILRKIRHRNQKEFNPRDADGRVFHRTEIDGIDMTQGDWLILGRNNYILDPIEEYCRQRGFSYTSKKWDQESSEIIHAIRIWEHLRKGNAIAYHDVKTVYNYISSGKGIRRGFKLLSGMNQDAVFTMNDLKSNWGLLVDDIWHRSLDRIAEYDRAYFIRALERGESLTKAPRIKISTMHGAKGGEATNVILLSDVSFKTWQEGQKNPDDEHRVFYVGATRSKENLYILQPTSTRYYEL